MNSKQWKRCSNCGHKGHFHKDCDEPKISIGIICFRYNTVERCLEFLLIRRKFTFAYTDFIRGNYEYQSLDELGELLNKISPTERAHILETKDFKKFWDEIWTSSNYITEKFKQDYKIAMVKFNYLINGFHYKDEWYDLEKLFQLYPTLENSHEPTWEFPKGKRDDPNESNVRCACREFYEETDIRSEDYEILFEYSPVVEIFTGNNNVKYKYIYFVGQCHDSNLNPQINPENKFQMHEIGDIGWFDWQTVSKKIKNNRHNCVNLTNLFHALKKKFHLDALTKRSASDNLLT